MSFPINPKGCQSLFKLPSQLMNGCNHWFSYLRRPPHIPLYGPFGYICKSRYWGRGELNLICKNIFQSTRRMKSKKEFLPDTLFLLNIPQTSLQLVRIFSLASFFFRFDSTFIPAANAIKVSRLIFFSPHIYDFSRLFLCRKFEKTSRYSNPGSPSLPSKNGDPFHPKRNRVVRSRGPVTTL